MTESYVAEGSVADMEEQNMIGDAGEEEVTSAGHISPDLSQPLPVQRVYPQQRRRWSMLLQGSQISEMLSKRMGSESQDRQAHRGLLPEKSSASCDRRRIGPPLWRLAESAGEDSLHGMTPPPDHCNHVRAPTSLSSAPINEEKALVIFPDEAVMAAPWPVKNSSVKEAQYIGLPKQHEEASEPLTTPCQSTEVANEVVSPPQASKDYHRRSSKSGFLVRAVSHLSVF
jgi:hypothetical protein